MARWRWRGEEWSTSRSTIVRMNVLDAKEDEEEKEGERGGSAEGSCESEGLYILTWLLWEKAETECQQLYPQSAEAKSFLIRNTFLASFQPTLSCARACKNTSRAGERTSTKGFFLSLAQLTEMVGEPSRDGEAFQRCTALYQAMLSDKQCSCSCQKLVASIVIPRRKTRGRVQ